MKKPEMKKPDRFERLLLKRMQAMRLPFEPKIKNLDRCGMSCYSVLELLRKEHRWVERMVKKVDAWACQELADNDDVVAAILKQLKQRRK